MSSFVASKLDLPNKKIKAKDFAERLFSLPSELSLISVRSVIDRNYLILEIAESVSLNFTYLDEPLETPLKTKSIINFDRTGFMISSPSGIGIVTKGGAKKYIDTYIGRIIAKMLLDDESTYIPLDFSNEQMNPTNWGGELRYLKVSLPEVGSGTIAGKGLTSKIEDLDHLFGSFKQGKIMNFKVFSSSLKRTISVSSNGTVKVQNKDILPVFEYIKSCLK